MELQDGSFSFHAGVDTAVAVQCLLAAMEPSWNRNIEIEKHYPEHLDLQYASGDTSSAAKPAPAAETSSGKAATMSDSVSASGDTGSAAKPAENSDEEAWEELESEHCSAVKPTEAEQERQMCETNTAEDMIAVDHSNQPTLLETFAAFQWLEQQLKQMGFGTCS